MLIILNRKILLIIKIKFIIFLFVHCLFYILLKYFTYQIIIHISFLLIYVQYCKLFVAATVFIYNWILILIEINEWKDKRGEKCMHAFWTKTDICKVLKILCKKRYLHAFRSLLLNRQKKMEGKKNRTRTLVSIKIWWS